MTSVTTSPAFLNAGMPERKGSMSPAPEAPTIIRTQLPIGGVRRASDGVLTNVERRRSPSTPTIINSGWARRPVATNSIGTERERQQLLRSISHLPKIETTPTTPAKQTEEGSSHSAFNRYDLVPPPNYRARSSQNSLGRVRGWSVSEDRRDNGDGNNISFFYSATNTNNNNSNSNNASSLSLSLSTTNLATQGRAKAVSAAVKIRKQLGGGNKKSEASRIRSSSASSELNLAGITSCNNIFFQSPSEIINVDAERQLGARTDSRSALGKRNLPESLLSDATKSIPTYPSSRHQPSMILDENNNASQSSFLQSGDLDSASTHASSEIPLFRQLPNESNNCGKINALFDPLPSKSRRPSHLDHSFSSNSLSAEQSRTDIHSTFSRPISPGTIDHLPINKNNVNEEGSFVLENSPSRLVFSPVKSSSAASTLAGISASSTYASPPRTPKISFDLSRQIRSGSTALEASRLGTRRATTVQSNAAVAEPRSTMKDQGRNNIIAGRRGSAPTTTPGDGKIKTSFKLGMMRLTGSTVDLTQFDGGENRRGSHLERSSMAEDGNEEEILASSPISTNESASPRNRFSFSMTRRRQSQDVPKPSTFSIFSKMNRSRDTLQLSTMDVANDGSFLREPGNRRKSDASSITRQFFSKALRRSSRQDLPPQDDSLSSAAHTRPLTQDVDLTSPINSSDPESAHQIFATAFGPPQRSDAHSAQAFETNVSSGATFQQQMRRAPSSVRASQDSSATSFFSTAETSSNFDNTSRPTSRYFAPSSSNPASPFGSYRGIPRLLDQGTGGSPRSPARHITLDPGEQGEEGPMGERWQGSEDANGISRPTSGLALNDLSRPITSKAKSQAISSPTGSNMSPSEQGSFTTHHSRSTAPSSLPTSVLIPSPTTQHNKQVEFSSTLNEETQPADSSNQPIITAEEQDFFNSTDAMESANNTSSNNGGGGNSSGTGGSNRRAGRSSRLLHLPRLNSLRVVSGASNGINGGDEDGSDGEGERRSRETSIGGAGEQSSDSGGEETGGDETQEDEDSDHDSRSSTEISNDSGAERESRQGSIPLSRNDGEGNNIRPRPRDIVLPPAPSFASPIASTSTPAPGLFSEVVGRDSWEQFSHIETPLETPQAFSTPRPNQTFTTTASPLAIQQPQRNITPNANTNSTPKGTIANEGDNSYFDLKPTTPRTVMGNGVNIPPPSPSIITRSRAASSASRRSTRSSLRDLPPMPPISPLMLRGLDSTSFRAKSPGRSTTTSTSPLRAEPSKRDSLPPLPSYRQAPPKAAISTEREERTTDSSRTNAANGQVSSSFAPIPSSTKAMGRPGLYQQQSRSLIELSSAKTLRENLLPSAPLPAATMPSNESPVYSAGDSGLQTPTGSSTPGGVRRRRSMFEVGAQPPPYAVVHDRPEGKQMIFPREEEGKELLPKYFCSVHIEGYLPRKMEFSSPGLQAKDRSWRRQYFVLHGTCLKVYKSDLSGENMVGKGEWGESDGVHVHKEPMNEDGPVGPAATTTAIHAKDGSNSTFNSQGQGHNNHHSMGNNNNNNSSSSGFNAAVEAVSALKGSIYHGNKTGLLKTYSLQGAESGLAADYLKRRHVVRVRVEGEQFLLQTRNDRHVVDWIEAFQAATNVSLDLERRPMPKFITLPRRRRRRRRGENGAADPSTAREEAEIAEAQRRSIAENQSGGSTRPSSSGRLPPARPLGLPGDESPPHASAAMDDMLREEHESMMRQDASDV